MLCNPTESTFRTVSLLVLSMTFSDEGVRSVELSSMFCQTSGRDWVPGDGLQAQGGPGLTFVVGAVAGVLSQIARQRARFSCGPGLLFRRAGVDRAESV